MPSGIAVGCSLRPEVVEDHRGNGDADQNADHAIADFIKISGGCVALELAEKKSERDLQAGVADSFASGGDPRAIGVFVP